jgi:hypothetical protein
LFADFNSRNFADSVPVRGDHCNTSIVFCSTDVLENLNTSQRGARDTIIDNAVGVDYSCYGLVGMAEFLYSRGDLFQNIKANTVRVVESRGV